ncbi:MAG: LysM domain-containing protein, partial [Chloroflexi bacterium]|nr:LysM domain-containing protein [Chloroflexota bacterium]
PPQQVTEYEVQSGDSLILIAERLIVAGGDVDDFVDAIAALNGMTDAGLIEIGEVLQIPAQ